MTKVDIVIVNWNAGDLLARCLASIAEHGGPRVDRVIVVDNGSTDGSAAAAAAPVELIEAGRNLGFGKACNLGASRGTASLLLFFNPDAELRAGAIDAAASLLESAAGADVGVCGIKLVDQHGEAHRHCARLPTWRTFIGNSLGLTRALKRWFPPMLMTEFDHLSSRDVDHVMGAFYLIRRDLFEALGWFDER
ncbi:MAG TPA: glycosyltransferase, partial [Sphingomicrobium sp.]